MKDTIKDILEKSGKKITISYKEKENRKSFDENYGKEKMEIISHFIGDNSILLSEKLNKK